MPYTSGLSTAGSVTQATSRVKHRVNVEAGTVELAYGNFYNNAGTETVGPNDITVKAYLEFPLASTYYVPVTFGGAPTVVIKPGGIVWSDPIALDLPVGSTFYSRTNVSVATTANRWPIGWATLTADGEGVITGVDYADGSGTVTANNTFCYSPLSIRGRTSCLTKAVAGIGDSIMSGSGDSNTKGWWFRSFTDVVPEQRISYASEQATAFNRPDRRGLRLPLLDGCTHLICANGVNDVKAPQTVATIKAELISNWRYGMRRGMKVWQTTVTPVTTSTDGWVTTANQTVTANEANRTAVNDWLRDGAPLDSVTFAAQAIGSVSSELPSYVRTRDGSTVRAGAAGHPLTGVLEFADAVETSRNSGIWKAGYTSDGTHPLGATGHGALAATFTLAQLGLA
jgi:hypothetical protein